MNYINYTNVYYVIQEGLQMKDVAFQHGGTEKIFTSMPDINYI